MPLQGSARGRQQGQRDVQVWSSRVLSYCRWLTARWTTLRAISVLRAGEMAESGAAAASFDPSDPAVGELTVGARTLVPSLAGTIS